MANRVFTKILVPVDGSKYAQDAVEYALKIAKLTDAEIIALHIMHLPTYAYAYSGGQGVSPVAIPTPLPVEVSDNEKNAAKKIVDDAAKMAEGAGVDMETKVVERHPSVPDAIIQFASEANVDLIVIGTKGKTAIKRFLLGSVTESVVHHAHCPVLVVR